MINSHAILEQVLNSKNLDKVRDLSGGYIGVFIKCDGKIYASCVESYTVRAFPKFIKTIEDAKSYLNSLNSYYKKGFDNGKKDIQNGFRKLINFDEIEGD
jgi:hypothetical protein